MDIIVFFRNLKDSDWDIFVTKKWRVKNVLSHLSELEKWQNELEKSIQGIGEDKIRQRPHMDWVFDEGDEPHFEHHIKQIKKALKY